VGQNLSCQEECRRVKGAPGGRFLQDPEGLWFKVLAEKYGLKDGQGDSRVNMASNWWKVIHRIRCGTGTGVGRWFGDNIFGRVGDEEMTLFFERIVGWMRFLLSLNLVNYLS
jgi:hypothetical protein